MTPLDGREGIYRAHADWRWFLDVLSGVWARFNSAVKVL